jgi:hypothetical protein
MTGRVYEIEEWLELDEECERGDWSVNLGFVPHDSPSRTSTLSLVKLISANKLSLDL